MREVSCRALDVFFRQAAREKRPTDGLIEGLPYDLAHFRDRHERIEWQVFVRFMENAAKYWTDDEFIEIGREFARSPLIRTFTLVGRLLFTLRAFYRWITTAAGGGNQMFTCMRSTFEAVDAEHVTIRVALAPGCRPSKPFFLVTKGCYEELPTLFGERRATVDLVLGDDWATYTVRCSETETLLGKLRRVVAWPFAVWSAARELKESNEQLHLKNEEIEKARVVLLLQAVQLRTAHRINDAIRNSLDLDDTLNAICAALVEEGGFASVVIDAASSEDAITRHLERGAPTDDAHHLLFSLVSGGRKIGSVQLWATVESDMQERRELLGFVIPTVAVAVNDALTYSALLDSRNNLDQKVRERTRELAEAQASLEATIERMREAQEARDRLFANVNHELRTPLSLVTIAVAEMRSRLGEALDARAHASLDAIDSSARRLLRLVDGMLLLAAANEGKLTLQLADLDLGGVLARLVRDWQPVAERYGLRISYSGPAHVACRLDEIAVERMVTNLVSNAVKFTPHGGSVDVDVREQDGRVAVAVRDTGVGIDDEFKKRVFGRFEQGRPALHGVARGSGLGLSIVKQLAESHGGSVEFETPQHGGSLFRIVLPRVAVVEDGGDGALDRASLRREDATDSLGITPEAGYAATVVAPEGAARATVLVAEDDPQLRRSTAELLARDYRVIVAGDGIEALELARKHMPDILVSDVGMPGIDGLELTRRFRELPGNRLAPVLLLTAFGSLGDRLLGFDAGALDYIIKPFAPSELRARVATHLKLRDAALKLAQSEKLASLGVLASGLAHELRNPANALVNACAPLRACLPHDALADGTPAAKLFGVVETCAQQVATLSRQLLGFKRPGALTYDHQRFATILDRALASVQPVLEGVTLRKDVRFDGTVPCAGALVSQVITNLLENAAHAAGRGGWASLEARGEGSMLVIDVTDSGPGVPVELRERIFEPFFTTKPPGKGTGLGLTTSREIVERHGGTLRVLPHGATTLFRVELPLGTASQEPGKTARLTPVPAADKTRDVRS